MIARRLLVAGLAAAVAACAAGGKSQVGVAWPPKGSDGSPTPTAASPLVTASPGVVVTNPSPLGNREWPAPFTYGRPTPPATPIPGPVQPIAIDPAAVNILLIGSDRRTGTAFRTDTLILLSIHPKARGAVLLSIPRDLYVYLPGYTMFRVNGAWILGEQFGYPGGGPAMLADTLLYNLGLTVHHYAVVEMSGFRRVIDTLGGVDVHVACSYTDWRLRSPNLDPENEANWALFTVPSGVVHMDGDYALWYARSRARSSDFDRSRRQQEVLRAVNRKALRLGVLPRVPALYEELRSVVQTDMTLSDILELAPLALQIDASRVRSRFIGRDLVTSWTHPVSGARVVLPKAEAIRAMLEEAFRFEASDPLVPESLVTVEVVNASNRPDWATLAAERLNYAGFAAHVAATRAEAAPTQLIDLGRSEASVRERIAGALRLRTSQVGIQPDPASPFAFRLIVGDDYNACFDPTRSP